MAVWSENHRACKTTWSTLRVLEQTRRTFSKAGKLKMPNLTFWSDTDPKGIRAVKARTLAMQMDNIFRDLRGARFEKNKSRSVAIDDMVKVLTNKDRTIAELAEVNDSNYKFWKEGED